MQAVRAVLPACEEEFAGQSSQIEAPVPDLYLPPEHSVQIEKPVAALYVPAKHGVQVPPSGPLDPALHRHAARAVLPAGEPEFAGHGTQTGSTK